MGQLKATHRRVSLAVCAALVLAKRLDAPFLNAELEALAFCEFVFIRNSSTDLATKTYLGSGLGEGILQGSPQYLGFVTILVALVKNASNAHYYCFHISGGQFG